jgi:ubiquinone/menaquinone biosynthesis C-methylase UbiE
MKARADRQWLLHPEVFNPDYSVIERERVHRTWKLIKPLLEEPEQVVADLGLGWGTLARKIRERGASVDAVDVSENALKNFRAQGPCDIRLSCEALPHTSLPDDHYDIVVCADVIADLEGHDQRLLVSELYRLLKPTGHLVCSTPLDYTTDGALERFSELLETEFEIIEWDVSHHAYSLRFMHLLEGPHRRLENRSRFHWLWRSLDTICYPLASFARRSRPLTFMLEGLCRGISPDQGVTHAICVAKRKTLTPANPEAFDQMAPQNQRLRRRVWE